MTYDVRREAGLDDRPVILVCTDSAVLPTGLARVVRGICTPIFQRGDFQIVQHGWFHIDSGNIQVPWKIVPVQRHARTPKAFSPEDKSGAVSFDPLVENLKPDIVFVIADYGRFDHILNSPHRSSFVLVSYLPLDTTPPVPKWAEVARGPDRVVYYTDFAARWGEACGVPGVSVPHGVDLALHQSYPSDQRKALREKFFGITDDTVIVGTIGRNQTRKRYDLLIEALAHLRAGGYARCRECEQVTLYSYVLPGGTFEPPSSWDCLKCRREETLEPGSEWDKLVGYLHTDPDEPNPDAVPIRRLIATWALDDYIKLNTSIDLRAGQGLSDNMLVSFMNCFDIFAHCANGGGWELPPMEAAACGLPLVAVDAPAQNEWLATLPGCQLVSGQSTWLRDADGYRVQGDIDDLVAKLLVYLEDPAKRQADGAANVEWAKRYNWDDISKRWEEVFREVLDPEKRIDGWRILVEA